MTQKWFLPEDYQCEEDRKLILEIMNHEAAIKLLNWIREQNIDEVYNSVYRSSFLRLNEHTSPALMEALENACGMFGLEQVPPVYLTRDFEDTITIGGISEPFLMISQRYLTMLEQEQPDLMRGIIAGQVAGICVGHHRGLLLVWLLDTILSLVAIPQVLVMALDALLNDWKRCRVYTCDRAMYLAMGDYPLALRGILSTVASPGLLDAMGLGTPEDAYRHQIAEFMDNSALDEAVNLLNSALTDTGWLPLRCHKLAQFAGVSEQEADHGN